MEGGASRLWELIGGGWGDPRGAGEAMKVGPQSRGGPGWRREPELGAVGVQAAVWSGRSGSRKEGLFGDKTGCRLRLVPRGTHLTLYGGCFNI